MGDGWQDAMTRLGAVEAAVFVVVDNLDTPFDLQPAAVYETPGWEAAGALTPTAPSWATLDAGALRIEPGVYSFTIDAEFTWVTAPTAGSVSLQLSPSGRPPGTWAQSLQTYADEIVRAGQFGDVIKGPSWPVSVTVARGSDLPVTLKVEALGLDNPVSLDWVSVVVTRLSVA